MSAPEKIQELVERGALFVGNHSGGKDSQATALELQSVVPASQLIFVHAHLEEVEWEGSEEFIRSTIGNAPLLVAQAKTSFFQMVERRGMFPSPKNRQCTSDLKRGPIEREIRRYLKLHPEHRGQVVSCMGMRAQESVGRSRLVPLKLNQRNSVAGREWYDWLPIHDWSTEQVFHRITEAGQQPFWVYRAGMSRKSCPFCIMSSETDMCTAARLKPDLYRRYVKAEREKGFTLSMSRRTLPEITGIPA